MTEWWNTLSPALHFYWFIGFPSSALFIIQTALILIGIGDSHFFDHDFSHTLLDSNHVDTNTADSLENVTATFKFLTLRNIIVFFTVFSWCGIVLTTKGINGIPVFLIALTIGLLLMFIISLLYYFITRMTEEGTMNLNNAVNCQGEVYLTIPAMRTETGKVNIIVQGALRELEAITDGEEILTGEKVLVTEIVDNQYLLVEKYNVTGGIKTCN